MFLQINQLCKSFSTAKGSVNVLHDIEMSIDQGEFVCVVGASGSGKSTLLRQIAGLDTPSAGEVLIEGMPVIAPSPNCGMVFQHYTLYPWMTIQENTEFGLKLQGIPKRQRREQASYYLNVVGLSEFAKALPKSLSGGMKQRVAIARALTSEPRILLLDEPFGALDIHTKESLHEFIQQLWQQMGLTVFMITHDVEEAIFLATRIYALESNPGRIQREMQIQLPDRSPAIKRQAVFHDYRDELMRLLRREKEAVLA